MTSIRIECPQCHRTYKIEEKILGKKVTCATEGCGTKFIAERPIATEDSPAPTELAVTPEPLPPSDAPEPLRATGSSNRTESPKPTAPPETTPPPDESDDPFGDLDLESLSALPLRRSSEQPDDDAVSLPPPLPKRRTTPSAPAITHDTFTHDTPKAASGGSGKLVLGLLCVAIVAVTGWIALNFLLSRGSATNTQPEATKNPLAELLYLTDCTLRLMHVSDDAGHVREMINQWTKVRNTVPKSADTEVSLEVIGGHLNAMYDALYVSESKLPFERPERGESTMRWINVSESRVAIRAAQTQLMHLAKLPWKVVQRTDLCPSTTARLYEEARRIAVEGQVGPNNLPSPLNPNDKQPMVRTLNSLYAKIPLPVEFHAAHKVPDKFTIPARARF